LSVPAAALRRSAWWFVLFPLAAALAVLAPLFARPLGYDDFMHLYNLVNFGVVELLVTPHAGHLLFFTNVMYVPLYALFGVQATPYAVLSLVTHAVNVALCYALVLRLTGRVLAAAAVTTLWGCAAFHEASVGAFAVYGQVILATIVLVLLHRLVSRATTGTTRGVTVDALLLLAAAGSFGYGLAVAAVWPAIRTYVADESRRWRDIALRVLLAAVAVGVLYAAVGLLHDATSDRAPYDAGSLMIRLRRARASELFLFELGALDRLGYALLTTFVGPVSTLVTLPPHVLGAWLGTVPPLRAILAFRIVGGVWLAACLYWARGRTPFVRRFALGAGAIAMACYLTVAVTRDLGWFNLFYVPARLAGRYEYLPSLALTIATAALLPSIATGSRAVRNALVVIVLAWTALVVALDWMTVRIPPWILDAQPLAEAGLTHAVQSFSAGSVVYIDNEDVIPFALHDERLPGAAAIASLRFTDGMVDGRRVLFVEHDPALLRQIRRRPDTPIARLVVAPDEIPPDAHYVRRPIPRLPPHT